MSASSKDHFYLADLFCGGGGTTTGAVEAVEAAGRKPKVTAINHNPLAIETHTLNHPVANHLCTDIDDVDPRKLYDFGQLDLLWASPECTHHSRARGGKPMSDQSRATGHCVTRWAEALRPPVILVENVPEFLDWGPLGANGLPLKSRKGATFKAWVALLESLGYKVGHRILCAADYGDPTTRERLFVQAVSGRRKVTWPNRTHAPIKEITRLQKSPDLFLPQNLKPWSPARDILDKSLVGRWLDEMPGKKKYGGLPLSPKTLRRIIKGFFKHGLKVRSNDGSSAYIVPTNYGERTGQAFRSHDLDQPMPTVVGSATHGIVEPVLEQYIIPKQTGENRVRSIDQPLQTVLCEDRGIGLVAPFIVGAGGSEYAAKPRAVDQPLNTVLCENRQSIVDPYLISIDHHGNQGACASGAEEPLGCVTTKQRHGIVEGYIVELRGTAPQQCDHSSASLNDPLSTVATSGAHHGLAESYLIQVAHGESGGDRSRSLDAPLNTVCGQRGDMALIEPSLLPQQSGGRLRPVSQPAPTVATSGAIAVVEAFLVDPYVVKFYGTGVSAPIDRPLDTVTTKERFALVCPEIQIGNTRLRVRFRWRMLQPHELQLAQGFHRSYRFAGNKTQSVKQIGNAVPRRLARALVYAAITQNPDVSILSTME